MQGDLSTTARVKAWLGSPTMADANLPALIHAASVLVLNYVGKSTFGVQSCVERYDGNGQPFMLLRQWPVLSIASIGFGSTSITAQASDNPCTPGYFLDAPGGRNAMQRVDLRGHCFPRGRQNVTVSYKAGYLKAEADVIPATPYQITTGEMWLDDQGVSFTGGAALAAVAGTPTTGQYQVAGGVYTFAAADAGRAVTISYSYVPADVIQIVNELVGESSKASGRIGLRSESLGPQQTIAYLTRGLNPLEMLTLNTYKRVTPV